jgi:hypothetical protein
MPHKTEPGFVADGPERHLEGIESDFRRRLADIQHRLNSGESDPNTRIRLEQEMAELERDYRTAIDKAKEEAKRGLF